VRCMTREEWLTSLIEKLRPTFERCGVQHIPRFRVSCGLPSRRAFGKGRRIVGECFPLRVQRRQDARNIRFPHGS